MMYNIINGTKIPLTAEEEAEMLKAQAEMPVEPPTEMEILSAKLDAILEYQGLKLKAIDDRTFEVVKGEVAEGDYTNPILIPVDGITTEAGKWYYVTDKDLPHEALQNAFVMREDFDDRLWFDFV